MREKSVIEEELNKVSGMISELEIKRNTLRTELRQLELCDAKTSLRFPVGTILTRYDKWRKRTLRAIYKGVRLSRWGGVEDWGINIRKDGKEGAPVTLYWHDGWKPEGD